MIECRRCQAQSMANRSGISLSEDQFQSYITERGKMPTGNEEEGSYKPWCRYDQEVLYIFLTPDQQIIFRKAYPHIFRENLPEL
jgi:hypothetical protein